MDTSIHIQSFRLVGDRIFITKRDGSLFVILLNGDSGKAYWRYKNNTVSNVRHPGIYLGRGLNGRNYYAHNHEDVGFPNIVVEEVFLDGGVLFNWNETITKTRIQIIESALQQVVRGERYHLLSYNCQSFVNVACCNQRKSQAVNNWGAAIGFTAFVLLLAAAFSNSGSKSK